MIEFYGSSETSFISWQAVNEGKKTSSVGKLFPHVELTLGPKYRLTVKSPYLFSGYLNQPYPQSWTTDDLGTLKIIIFIYLDVGLTLSNMVQIKFFQKKLSVWQKIYVKTASLLEFLMKDIVKKLLYYS